MEILRYCILVVILLLRFHTCLSISLRDEMMLTDEQREGFERFKAKALPLITTPYMKNDIVLIKYYRASGLDETKAMDRMRDNLKWRLDMGFESLTEDELNEYSRDYPYSTLDDKMGRGVFFLVGKYWELTRASKTEESTKKFTQYAFHAVEEAYAKGVSNITGKTASGIAYLEDMYALEMSKSFCVACGTMIKDIMNQIDKRWPGGMQIAIIVNAQPMLVPTINLLKNALPENLQKSVFIYDEDDKVWMPEVLKLIRKDQIPAELYVRSEVAPQIGGGGKPGGGASIATGLGSILGGGGGGPDGNNDDAGFGGPSKKKTSGRGMGKSKAKKKNVEDDDDGNDK